MSNNEKTTIKGDGSADSTCSVFIVIEHITCEGDFIKWVFLNRSQAILARDAMISTGMGQYRVEEWLDGISAGETI